MPYSQVEIPSVVGEFEKFVVRFAFANLELLPSPPKTGSAQRCVLAIAP